MLQPRPLGRAGKLTVEKVPVTHEPVVPQLKIVKLLPATGTKPLISETLSVPPSEAVPVVAPTT
jgi:hypothetical protein